MCSWNVTGFCTLFPFWKRSSFCYSTSSPLSKLGAHTGCSTQAGSQASVSREPFPQGFIFHHGKFTYEDLSKMWIHQVVVCLHRGGRGFHSHHRARRLGGGAAGGQVTGRCGDVVHKPVVLLFWQSLSRSIHLEPQKRLSLAKSCQWDFHSWVLVLCREVILSKWLPVSTEVCQQDSLS